MCSGQCGGAGGSSGEGKNKSLEDALDKQFGRTQSEIAAAQRRAARDCKEFLEKGGGRGNMPADIMELIEALTGESKVPWREKMSYFLRTNLGRITSGMDDYSMARQNRRGLARRDGIIRPGLIKRLPEIVIILDTSGSMHGVLPNILRESYYIAKAAGLHQVLLCEVDAVVASIKRIPIEKLKNMELHGMGGTDFRPPFVEIAKLKNKPNLAIYLTDGMGPAPEYAPRDLHTIWGVIGQGMKAPAAWGDCVYIDEY
jgi:predicted metal-dependent peptidase